MADPPLTPPRRGTSKTGRAPTVPLLGGDRGGFVTPRLARRLFIPRYSIVPRRHERQQEPIDGPDKGTARRLGADPAMLERRQEPGIREAISGRTHGRSEPGRHQ